MSGARRPDSWSGDLPGGRADRAGACAGGLDDRVVTLGQFVLRVVFLTSALGIAVVVAAGTLLLGAAAAMLADWVLQLVVFT